MNCSSCKCSPSNPTNGCPCLCHAPPISLDETTVDVRMKRSFLGNLERIFYAWVAVAGIGLLSLIVEALQEIARK